MKPDLIKTVQVLFLSHESRLQLSRIFQGVDLLTYYYSFLKYLLLKINHFENSCQNDGVYPNTVNPVIRVNLVLF